VVGNSGPAIGGERAAAAAEPDAHVPDEAARLAGLVAAVLADEAPASRLGRELDLLEAEQRPALAAALFESLVYRIDTRDFWLYLRMWKVYAALGPGREDAAYFAAALAVQMAPAEPASGHAFNALFGTLRRRGRFVDAAGLFRHQLLHAPEDPAVEPWEIAPLLAEIGEALPPHRRPPSAPADRHDHHVVAPEVRPPWICAAVGGVVPRGLVSLASGRWQRPAIDVAELRDADVLILRNAVLVVDRNGVLHGDLSVAAYPEEVRRKFERMERQGAAIHEHEAPEAVVISDHSPPPNLCHFLLDQLTRLALYQRVGVDPARALVIGPEPSGNFRQAVLRRAGATSVLSTEQCARVRVRRLWVSSNCREVRHFAHWGAEWAIEFVRQTLGGRGIKGWRRLYVSRSDAARRRVVNEPEIAALLEPLGFEVIVPGRMPYQAQVAAFKQASHVIAPHGAALAHLVLCPPDARILEIFHPLFTENAFAMQVQAASVEYVAMVARDACSDAPEWNDPALAEDMTRYAGRDIRVDLPALSRYLATAL
jgi:capsular polysaccharide biosynthesis protein